MSYLQDSPSIFFCPTSRSSQESKGFLFRRAPYKDTYVEAVESVWAGLSPKEGDVRNKKRKRPRKARRWLPRSQGSMCPQPRISFLGSRVFGFGTSPSCLKYRLLWDLVYEEAMCEGSSGNGPPYAAKAVPWKDYFTQVEDPAAKHCSKEGPHYPLGAKREREICQRQATINFFSRVWYPWWFLLGLYCVAWLTQENVSSRIFVRRKWETHAFCTRNMGAHVQSTSSKKLVSSDCAKILNVATKIRETCEKTFFTPSSPVKATKLYRFCLSNKRLPKLPINV